MTATRSLRRRAFTLLELVVVIGIIVLLASLVLGVASIVSAQSERRECEGAIALLDTAIAEYESASGRPITYGQNMPAGAGQPAKSYDIQSTLADSDIVVATLNLLDTSDSAKTILSKIGGNLLRPLSGSTVGTLEFVDPWDRRVMVVYPGAKWVAGQGVKDVDGTIRTVAENTYGICRNRKALIVSGGPDGQLGKLDGTDAQRAQANDNVYSYEPEKP
ncbi:MAG: type II secretion system protein [Phycisphaerales bacterium]|nr:type II secretion system protein [Phycisphaerales bacterium]